MAKRKYLSSQLLSLAVVLCASTTVALERYVSPSGGNVPPFQDWGSAATNIQDVIDVSEPGDVIWVTNGVYASGGKVMAGDLTNRVVLDKALTVRSVNGPFVTSIQGSYTTNGPGGIRCAWLTNGALLSGFTLQGGATRATGDTTTLQNGGGVWCVSSNAALANCILKECTAFYYGGGAYRAALDNCAIITNRAFSGGGVYGGVLRSCTVVSNSAARTAGIDYCAATNCVMYYNGVHDWGGPIQFAYCCTPQYAGLACITAPPELLPDSIHLSIYSPCRSAGTNLVSGSDIDGQPWANPPAIGCDEWQPAPIPVGPITIGPGPAPGGLALTEVVAGEAPFTCWWLHNGSVVESDAHFLSAHSTNLVISGLGPTDAGSYQVVISNAFGMGTSEVAQVVIHCVDVASGAPASPYLTWSSAATNIQDAIDASAPNEIVLVTNGLYATGGKAMYGDLTNRVAVDKPLLLESANGPLTTVIQGARDPAGNNGPLAVRCVWLTNGATLFGFTLQNGATRSSGDTTILQSGGGVWSLSSNVVANCLLVSNCAYQGGGAYCAALKNCSLQFNTASYRGGGAFNSLLLNCTVVSNSAPSLSGGVYGGRLTNCIVYFNTTADWDSAALTYCCVRTAGTGNFVGPPQLLPDCIHLANTSSCRGAGTNVSAGVDIDGQPWANPPSVGCDEWQPAPAVPTAPKLKLTRLPLGFSVSAWPLGQEPLSVWWLRNGEVVLNDGHFSSALTTNLQANGILPSDPGGYQLVVSNAFGVVTSAVTRLVGHHVDATSATPAAPYLTWASAATNIQDAVDAAQPGEVVLVTNGLYASGGRVMEGDLLNRVAVTNAVIVTSVNGAAVTAIQGAWDPSAAHTGPQAVRCAWLGEGATLSGFTLRDGATRATGSPSIVQNGGGVLGTSTNAWLVDCTLSNNVAVYGGGGFNALFNRCLLVGNSCSQSGGGAYQVTLRSCFLAWNSAVLDGGGAYASTLDSCTATANNAGDMFGGGGVYNATVRNSIVYGNYARYDPFSLWANWGGPGYFAYSCTTPVGMGTGNISSDPQLLDNVHLKLTSHRRQPGAGPLISTARARR